MSARQINDKIDALFVEGADDGVVVNALIKKRMGIDLTRHPGRVVRTNDDGGGDAWAIRTFEQYIATERQGARVGVIVDRDELTNDKWPVVSAVLHRLGAAPGDGPPSGGVIVGGRYGIWMWPDNESHGDLEHFVAGIIPSSSVLEYAAEACRIAKAEHAAEYDLRHARRPRSRSAACGATRARRVVTVTSFATSPPRQRPPRARSSPGSRGCS